MEVMSWSGTALVMLSSPGTGREALGTRQIAATISAFVVETERQNNRQLNTSKMLQTKLIIQSINLLFSTAAQLYSDTYS